MQKNYSGSIALTKLQSAVVELNGKSGKIKGVFIPIDQNHLVAGKENAYYLPVRVITKETDAYGQNGFISQTVDTKTYKEATDEQKEEFKKLPILGNIKDFTAGGGDDASGVVQGTFTETDDLPF